MKNNKTIGVTVRFFTNNLSNGRNFRTSGSVILEANKKRGIKSQSSMFGSYKGILRAIKIVMKKAKLQAEADSTYAKIITRRLE